MIRLSNLSQKKHCQGNGDQINGCRDDYDNAHFVNPLLMGENHLIPVGMFYKIAESPQIARSGEGFVPGVAFPYVPRNRHRFSCHMTILIKTIPPNNDVAANLLSNPPSLTILGKRWEVI